MRGKNKKVIKKTVSEKERIARYLGFVILFNKFINHKRKFRHPFIARDMRI